MLSLQQIREASQKYFAGNAVSRLKFEEACQYAPHDVKASYLKVIAEDIEELAEFFYPACFAHNLKIKKHFFTVIHDYAARCMPPQEMLRQRAIEFTRLSAEVYTIMDYILSREPDLELAQQEKLMADYSAQFTRRFFENNKITFNEIISSAIKAYHVNQLKKQSHFAMLYHLVNTYFPATNPICKKIALNIQDEMSRLSKENIKSDARLFNMHVFLYEERQRIHSDQYKMPMFACAAPSSLQVSFDNLIKSYDASLAQAGIYLDKQGIEEAVRQHQLEKAQLEKAQRKPNRYTACFS